MRANRNDPRWDAMLPGASWPRRRETLRELFETIAPSYDRLNHWLSLGLDLHWRSRAAREAIQRDAPGLVLDLASGTGDQAAALLTRSKSARVIRLDLSPQLLRRAAGKGVAGKRAAGKGAAGKRAVADASAAPPVVAEMERLPFRDGSLDAITMAFALRHVESLDRLMEGCARALRLEGRISFVDMALPRRGAWARIYLFYFRSCLPRLAALLGGDRRAYEAMVRSVESFPGWDRLEEASRKAGLRGIRLIPMTRGAARIFFAKR
jgi:demethylmenaquinone methyltransferase/2-methoxy-6-polyprenyl-1,4-benzoquinol methylase